MSEEIDRMLSDAEEQAYKARESLYAFDNSLRSSGPKPPIPYNIRKRIDGIENKAFSVVDCIRDIRLFLA